MENLDMPSGVSTDNSSVNTPGVRKNKSAILGIVAVVLVIVLGGVAFWMGIFKQPSFSPGENKNSQSTSPTESVAGVKGARVNGEEISASQVAGRAKVILADMQAQGVQIGPEQENFARQNALQQLINEVLLLQAAAKANIAVSDEQVEGQFQLVANSFASPEEFTQALVKNNTTVEQLKNDIRRQFTIQAFLDTQIDQEAIVVSDKEVEDLYNQYAANTAEMPPLESVVSQLKQQLGQQKFNQQVRELLQKLASEAQIEIL